jgi:hypothetical protein
MSSFSIADVATPPSEDFCTVFFRIIKSAAENNMENLKGSSLGTETKGYNKIERWKSIENLPGFENGIVTKSFGVSFTCNLWTCNEMNDTLVKMYDQWVYTIDDCLSPSWMINETPKEGFYKKMSVSRRDASEILAFPNINLEILKINDKCCLQLKIVK